MIQFLAQHELTARASGKAILIGEHAVVYGYPAVAFAFHGARMEVTLRRPCTQDTFETKPLDWVKDWKFSLNDKPFSIQEKQIHLLYKALALAFYLCGEKNLSQFQPHPLHMASSIPFGAGLGSSAATSVCFVDLAAQAAGRQLSLEERATFANAIDSLFHGGQASGVDVNTICHGGFVQFQKGADPKSVQNRIKASVVLVDTEERTDTAVMVHKVRSLLETSPKEYQPSIHTLGQLALETREALEKGDENTLAFCLNKAQTCLQKLKISTDKADYIARQLKKKYGALCAKVTGGGGGGLVLAIFKSDPPPKLLANGDLGPTLVCEI